MERKISFTMCLLSAGLLILVLFSLSVGRYPVPASAVFKMILAKLLGVSEKWPSVLETVVFKVRLPRVIAALLVGSGLSISGLSLQGVFRNPLVSPYILGVASGAGFGAALAILLFNGDLIVQASAFCFGMLAVLLAYAISRTYRATPVLVLVLSGVIVGAFFSSLISLIKYIADPYEKLPTIVFWLMGSLSSVSMRDITMVIFPMLFSMCFLMPIRWRINVLSLGEDDAKALGIATERLRIMITLCATLITASAVCISGIIGWVGLLIPHIARMIAGPDYRKSMPACLLLGAMYLLIVDGVARSLAGFEIPFGILTSTIGAPFLHIFLERAN